ncbi:MAG: dicarboxylate/amino acid:cation symporter [Bacteroidaceae bacterium]|nr:dicarboxylate/amino acid:cation symporter [Bacteroidaceae bacterium]
MKKIGLLPRILIAIVLGLVAGQLLPMGGVRLFATFNGVFSQFLNFLIPLIIVGLVTPAIGEVGRSAGKLLIVTVLIAYIDTALAGFLAYGAGSVLFPGMVEQTLATVRVEESSAVLPYFTVRIPAMFDVMAALVFSFLLGLGIAYGPAQSALKSVAQEFREVVGKTIEKAVIPLLPLYIFGIFLTMAVTGEAYRIVLVFAKIIVVIFVLHLLILFYEFCIAGIIVRRNPFRLFWTMVPAYMTALGTSSSAATIPVTLRQTRENGVSEGIAGFTIPLCATIHMSGSAMKITACALTICLLAGLPHDPVLFVHFIMMLGVVMVAAPGVPGGCIMAALGILSSILGFSSEQQALMIALYIAMDSFGTACNVAGDGAIALIVDKYYREKN